MLAGLRQFSDYQKFVSPRCRCQDQQDVNIKRQYFVVSICKYCSLFISYFVHKRLLLLELQQPTYLHSLITVQPPRGFRGTRSSSVVTLCRPPTSSMTNVLPLLSDMPTVTFLSVKHHRVPFDHAVLYCIVLHFTVTLRLHVEHHTSTPPSTTTTTIPLMHITQELSIVVHGAQPRRRAQCKNNATLKHNV